MMPSGVRLKRSLGHRQKELFKAAIVSCLPGSVTLESNKLGAWFVWLAAARMLLHKGTEHSIPERCRRFALGDWQQLWTEARAHEEKELRAKAGASSKLEGPELAAHAAHRLALAGELRRAMQRLMSTKGACPGTADVLAKLLELHPASGGLTDDDRLTACIQVHRLRGGVFTPQAPVTPTNLVEVTSSSDGGKTQLGVKHASLADIRAYRDALVLVHDMHDSQGRCEDVPAAQAAVADACGTWLPSIVDHDFSSRLIVGPLGGRASYVGASFSVVHDTSAEVVDKLDAFLAAVDAAAARPPRRASAEEADEAPAGGDAVSECITLSEDLAASADADGAGMARRLSVVIPPHTAQVI
jgi:hypothetical protein